MRVSPERALWVGLLSAMLLTGCPTRAPASLESLLPEQTHAVQGASPRALLEEHASELDPVVRSWALAGLVRASPEPGGGEWASRGLADPSAWVQRHTAEALVERLPDEATAQRLLTYVGQPWSDPYVRGRVALAVGASHPEAAREATGAAWRAEEQRWRRAPLALAAARLGDAEAVPEVLAAAARAEVALETDFVLELGRSELPGLAEAMSEGRPWVEEELELTWTAARLAAGDASAQGELRHAMDEGEDDELEILDALAEIPGERVDALLERAASSGSEAGRTYARLILLSRGVGNPGILEEAAHSERASLRALAARWGARAVREGALTRTRDLRELRRLDVELLEDPDPSVRLEAVLCLDTLGVEGEEEALRARLTDEEREVRLTAAALLARP